MRKKNDEYKEFIFMINKYILEEFNTALLDTEKLKQFCEGEYDYHSNFLIIEKLEQFNKFISEKGEDILLNCIYRTIRLLIKHYKATDRNKEILSLENDSMFCGLGNLFLNKLSSYDDEKDKIRFINKYQKECSTIKRWEKFIELLLVDYVKEHKEFKFNYGVYAYFLYKLEKDRKYIERINDIIRNEIKKINKKSKEVQEKNTEEQ